MLEYISKESEYVFWYYNGFSPFIIGKYRDILKID